MRAQRIALRCILIVVLVLADVYAVGGNIVLIVAEQIVQGPNGYRDGAEGPVNYDCSGLTRVCYGMAGIELPHEAALQALKGVLVTTRWDLSQFRPGDLLFFDTADQVGTQLHLNHVAIFAGGTKIVTASSRRNRVREAEVVNDGGWWARRFITSRRFVFDLEVSPTSITVATGTSVQPLVTARDMAGMAMDVPAANFSWSSSAPAIATVDASTGVVTGTQAGQATIKVQEKSSGKEATIAVAVTGTNGATFTVRAFPSCVQPGLQLTSTPAAIFCGINGNGTCEASFDTGTVVTLHAPATNLAGWDCNNDQGTNRTTTLTTDVIVTPNLNNCTALFSFGPPNCGGL